MLYQPLKHLIQRIESSTTINEETGCWEWKKRIQANGYGSMWAGRTEGGGYIWTSPHRVSYEVFYGPIPEGFDVAHRCHNPKCCNPNHLVAITHQENIQMSVDDNRTIKGEAKPNAKLNESVVKALRQGELSSLLTLSQMARIFDIHRSTLRAVLLGETWKHIEFCEA